jgi:hypothetical protein
LLCNSSSVKKGPDNFGNGLPLPNYRLPKNLVPYHYDLTIKPYFKVDEIPRFYDALVVINFTCVHETNKLTLNMKNLELSHMVLTSESDSVFKMVRNISWTYDHESTFFTADFGDRSFKKNTNYSFAVKFRGFTDSDNIGFYRSSYLDSNKKKKLGFEYFNCFLNYFFKVNYFLLFA